MNEYWVFIEIVGDESSRKMKVKAHGDTRQEAINAVLDGIVVHGCNVIGEEKQAPPKKPFGNKSMPDFFNNIFG